MKLLKRIALAVVACATFICASCAVSQAYADKINDAANGDSPITYEQAKKDLGDGNYIDVAKNGLLNVLISVKGVKTLDDLKAKVENGEKLKGIVISIVGGNCAHATYKEITAEDYTL